MELAPQVYVSGQIFAEDVRLLAKQGCRTIVCTEPDSDAAGQPQSADLAKVADEEGVVFLHFPVEPGSITTEEAEAFSRACEPLKRPVHVFSRSVAHAIKLWEMSE